MLAGCRGHWKGGIAAVGQKRISPGRQQLRQYFWQVALQNAARLLTKFPAHLKADQRKVRKINFMGE
jgi:hypothetical protein